MLRPVLAALMLSFLATVPASALELEAVIESPVKQDFRAEWGAYLRGQRAQRIQRLAVYSQQGVFPMKPDTAGFFHAFLDDNGTPCAMADLMQESGARALVRRTAKVNNGVVLSEVMDGPLVEWMLTSGLTREEVAIIQVPGFNRRIELSPIAIQPISPSAEVVEQQRIQSHLTAAIALLNVDTEASIDKALTRLGDKVEQAPPELVAMR